jgi:hypothetical protein
MSTGGDLFNLNRSTGWRWGVWDGSRSQQGSDLISKLDGNWHHMVLVYAEGVTKLYLDGVFK